MNFLVILLFLLVSSTLSANVIKVSNIETIYLDSGAVIDIDSGNDFIKFFKRDSVSVNNNSFRLRKKSVQDSEILEIGTTTGEVISINTLLNSKLIVEMDEIRRPPDIDFLRGGSDIGGGG